MSSSAISILNLGEPVLLFYAQDISNLTQHLMREAPNAVQKIPADTLLNTPTEDIIADLTDKHSVTTIASSDIESRPFTTIKTTMTESSIDNIAVRSAVLEGRGG